MADSSDVTAGVNATAAQYNNLRKDLILGQNVVGTESYGATTTFDMSDKTKGKIRYVTLGGNPTLAVSNDVDGQSFVVVLIQGAGGQTVTWWSGILWEDGVTPTLSTGSGKRDTFGFIKVSTGVYLGYILGQNQ